MRPGAKNHFYDAQLNSMHLGYQNSNNNARYTEILCVVNDERRKNNAFSASIHVIIIAL